MNDDTATDRAERPVQDFAKLAALGLFVACVSAMLYMFTHDLTQDHETMTGFLAVGAFLAAFEIL